MSGIISSSVLAVFVPTFFMVSLTPGMCMTLAMTLGISIGVRRSLWMMIGELLGVGLVATAAATGVASVMLTYPEMFVALKLLGGAYLAWLGLQMWRSQGSMAISLDTEASAAISPKALFMQGLVTAIANPKGWAFFIALLPPFLNPDSALLPQLSVLIAIILSLELLCMLIYATGGKTLRALLAKEGSVVVLNRIAGTMMLGVGVWLALG